MSSARGTPIVLERVAASLLGILSLGSLGLPFWEVRIGSYGWINLSSGLQLVLEGANPNLADLIWNAFPASVYESLPNPGMGYFTMPAILFMWWVILGALLVEVMGFVAILFTEGEYSRKFGRMIALGGKFVIVGGLFTAGQILYYLSQFSNISYEMTSSFGFYPGLALVAEPFLGIGMWILGSRIRHAHRLRHQA
jgi:hypothetical protein